MLNVNEAAADLFALNTQIKALTARAEELKLILKQHGSFTNELYDVKVTTTHRTSVDTKLLKTNHPDIAQLCSKQQEVTAVTVKKI